MVCPGDAIGQAIRKCPFLHKVSDEQGEQYARRFATRPAVPASNGRPQPVFEERSCDFEATLRLFHGSSGIVPLARFTASEPQQARSAIESRHHQYADTAFIPPARRQHSEFSRAPFATMSMSGAFNFLPGPRDLSDFLFGKEGSKPKPQRKPTQRPGTGSRGSVSSKGAVSGQAAAADGGQCPLGKFPGAKIVGGLIPLSAKGKLQCPRAIVAGRAFVARMQPVRDLRPQSLSVKLATLGAGTAVLNIPFGMWRDHTKKFSPEWFLAVHATIPFVAMTRQGIGMPKTVIFLTIAAAITGQAVGARLERKRMAWLADKQQTPAISQQATQAVQSGFSVPAVSVTRNTAKCAQASAQQADRQDGLTSLASSFLHSRQPVIHAL